MPTCWHQSVNERLYLDDSWIRHFQLKVKPVITLQPGPSLTVGILSLTPWSGGSYRELATCNLIEKGETLSPVVLRHHCEKLV